MVKEKKKETPIETPTEGPTMPEEELKVKETPKTGVDELVAELEKAGVSNTEDLEKKLVAAREAGNLANQLGQTRAELAEIKALLASEKSEPQRENYEQYESEGAGLDIKNLIGRALDERETAKAKKQTEIQQAVYNMWNEIQSDEDYGLVKEIWEERLKDPTFSFQLQQGMVNPIKEYNQVVRGYYKGIAKRSVDTIKTLQGKGGGTETPMHIEGGERTQQLPEEATKDEERLKELKKRANKGVLTEEEELEAIAIQTKGLDWI